MYSAYEGTGNKLHVQKPTPNILCHFNGTSMKRYLTTFFLGTHNQPLYSTHSMRRGSEYRQFDVADVGLGGSAGCASDEWSGGRGFDPHFFFRGNR